VIELGEKQTGGKSLADVIDRVLDKGLVINADISVSVVGVELLGVKIRLLPATDWNFLEGQTIIPKPGRMPG